MVNNTLSDIHPEEEPRLDEGERDDEDPGDPSVKGAFCSPKCKSHAEQYNIIFRNIVGRISRCMCETR